MKNNSPLRFFVLAIALLAFTISNAQIYTQNFETSKTVIPAGWSQQKAAAIPTNKGWVFSNAYAPSSGYLAAYWNTTGSYFAYVNDADNNSTSKSNYDTLYSTSFSLSGFVHVFVSLSVMYQQAGETATIAASTDGGKTWVTADTLYGVAAFTTETFNLSAYAGQPNVMLAICYADNAQWTWGLAIDNLSVFVPTNNYDLSVTKQNQTFLVQTNKPYTFTGLVYNYGGDSIVQMNMNYKVSGGSVQTDALTGLSFLPLTNYSFTHNIPWTPTTAGSYTVKFWADNLNIGNADQKHSNDTLVASFTVIDTIQVKMPLFEEFNQASCDPCAQATPNLDSVLFNNKAYCNGVRYHVSWPGQDFMNQETNSPFVSARVSFYGVSGVPDAKLDGSTDSYPGSISSSDIQTEAAIGSPFKITIPSCTYNTATDSFSIVANVKAYGVMPAGLKAQIALTVDTITYANNQSTESIAQYVFPQVAEDMMPSSGGTTLTAFTSGQTQTVKASWKKNRPWGASPKTWTYDSTSTHFTVFIQNNGTKYVYQSATAPTSIIIGINELSNNAGTMQVYPNPMSDNATVTFSLNQGQNVGIEIWNMLGQKVIDINEGKFAQGAHQVTIDKGNLLPGVYFLRMVTTEGVAIQKIEIQ